MSDIAAVVGIKKATLYSHFESKEAIFTLILQTVIKKHQKTLLQMLDSIEGPGALTILEKIYFEYINYCSNNVEVDFWTRFYYFPPAGLEAVIHDSTHSFEKVFMARLESIIRDGIEKEEIKDLKPEDIMLSYYYLLLGFVMSLNFYKDRETDTDAQRCISVFLAGISR